MRPVRLATRRSPLALAQSRWVAAQIEGRTGAAVELVTVSTRGDVDPGPLASIGGTGVFVAAVREAVLDGRADLAVHSLKDLPTPAQDGLVVAAIPERADPRDVLVSRHPGGLAELPAHARVGTGSPRRRAQLLALRPDLDVVAIRGNVDSRIALVHGTERAAAEFDAVVLAAAGLIRLGRADAISAHLPTETMLPAPGQGALAIEMLAIEMRAHHSQLVDVLRDLDDPPTRAAVEAERCLLAELEAGCSAPVGALGQVVGNGRNTDLHLRAVIADRARVPMSITGPVGQAGLLGRELAHRLLGELQPAD